MNINLSPEAAEMILTSLTAWGHNDPEKRRRQEVLVDHIGMTFQDYPAIKEHADRFLNFRKALGAQKA